MFWVYICKMAYFLLAVGETKKKKNCRAPASGRTWAWFTAWTTTCTPTRTWGTSRASPPGGLTRGPSPSSSCGRRRARWSRYDTIRAGTHGVSWFSCVGCRVLCLVPWSFFCGAEGWSLLTLWFQEGGFKSVPVCLAPEEENHQLVFFLGGGTSPERPRVAFLIVSTAVIVPCRCGRR